MHTSKHKDCGCGSKDCGCGNIKDVVNKVYSAKGENFLSPKNKTIADGFWNAGQSKKLTEGFLSSEGYGLESKKGGKKYGK